MDRRSRKPLHDVITAVRLGKPVANAALAAGQCRAPPALARAAGGGVSARCWPPRCRLAQRCTFSLRRDFIQLPAGDGAPGLNRPSRRCKRLHLEGAHERYPQGVPQKVQDLLDKELRADRAMPLRDVLSDGARHRALCRRRKRHPLPGPGLGGQLGGVLLPGHHRHGPHAVQPAAGALHQRKPQATSRPTSMWTSSTSGAKRSSSTSTPSTAASAPPLPPWSSATAPAVPSATWARRWACPSRWSMRLPASTTGLTKSLAEDRLEELAQRWAWRWCAPRPLWLALAQAS
jgi:hypothetical protein